jgi:hypothetical protein
VAKNTVIPSEEFKAPFVRVRGRISWTGEVRWSPCLRTFKPPGALVRQGPVEAVAFMRAVAAELVDEATDGYVVTFETAKGEVLETSPVEPEVYAQDQEWASFGARMPYHEPTERVVLRRHGEEVSVYPVLRRLPQFSLEHPTRAEEIDPARPLKIRWRGDARNPRGHPLVYYVRFSHDGQRWVRPGVNLTANAFDLDLREMPGGEECVAQVLATNGYQTAFAATPKFPLPRKRPEILLGSADGPVLFAQGFSREDGPIRGGAIEWLVDGHEVASGGSFDVRSVRPGHHAVAVRVTDRIGETATEELGTYDARTGHLSPGEPGL